VSAMAAREQSSHDEAGATRGVAPPLGNLESRQGVAVVRGERIVWSHHLALPVTTG
jgi:hypothetical protein